MYERRLARDLSALAAGPQSDPFGIGQEERRALLEAHVRQYFVNSLLAALNWRMGITPQDAAPNLGIEIAVRSAASGTTRFMDYLGADSSTRTPLLIVETKRPSYELPRVVDTSSGPSATYEDIFARGLAAQRLTGEWNDWLETLRDYAKSAQAKWGRFPRRVVITNGEWLVAFLDPPAAFNGTKTPGSLKILVFPTSADLEDHCSDAFLQLEYHRVLGDSAPLHAADVGFHIDPIWAKSVRHGLKLLYVEDPRIELPAYPVIRIAPVLFVELSSGGLVQVDGPATDFSLPDASSGLQRHFDGVSNTATQLLQEVREVLGVELPVISPNDNADGPPLDLQDSIRSLWRADGRHQYVMMTGTWTHFCRLPPSVLDCPYHEWQVSERDGVASVRGPRYRRSVSPRAFFMSGELNHCSHGSVALAKAALVSPENSSRCGWRARCEGEPFCGIWEFETELCCRTCVFESACTRAQAFVLPCVRE